MATFLAILFNLFGFGVTADSPIICVRKVQVMHISAQHQPYANDDHGGGEGGH